MKPIRIIGGGLAGLSLGIALRKAGIPVTITEAGRYPRHRVCGEFISGAGQNALETLGLGDILTGAVSNYRTTWHRGNRFLYERRLPAPALGLSRYQLDTRLAARFEESGGELLTSRREAAPPAEAGTIWACGRQGATPGWIALKLHCRGLEQNSDLSIHLGSRGYVGISRIEGEQFNICGLFQTRDGLSPGKQAILVAYLRANGLTRLADQVDAAEIDPESISATTALNFTGNPWPEEVICIGDSNTSIPPFAGNGMSMAFESAFASLPALLQYARNERSWSETRQTVRATLARRFRIRLAVARLLHPFLLNHSAQRVLSWTASHQLLPFQGLYRLLR